MSIVRITALTHRTLSLHDALPIYPAGGAQIFRTANRPDSQLFARSQVVAPIASLCSFPRAAEGDRPRSDSVGAAPRCPPSSPPRSFPPVRRIELRVFQRGLGRGEARH